MKPYFDDGTVRLYVGDCREIVPALGITAELILTDPPYASTSLAWDSKSFSEVLHDRPQWG